jgi:hypothetical protein
MKFLLVIAVVAFGGCNTEPTAPANALIGQWGGNRVELVSATNGVTVRFPCGALVGNGALVPDDAGAFAHTVRAVNPPSSEPLALEGTVTGNTIKFDLIAKTPNGTAAISFVVTRDVAPDFSGAVCSSTEVGTP